VGEVKKQLSLDLPEEKRKKKKRTLSVPLHRQAQHRIESGIAYSDSKRELSEWDPIVRANRVSEQLVFPLNDDNTVRVETAAERSENFTPRTELEKQMCEVLGKSKYNLRNEDLYTEAEKELIKAMDLKEAREKCAQMQKMRFLMSYRAAKFKQQAKIKSKQYHRIKKRQQRRQLMKEVEELMSRDPEGAREKLKELEVDRAFERGTLKHRGTNKWSKQIRQFASRNPELRKLVEEHLKFGRELKKKHGVKDGEETETESETSDEESENNENPLTVGELVELAAEKAYRESKEVPIQSSTSNPQLRKNLENIRKKRKELLAESKTKAVGGEWAVAGTEGDTEEETDFPTSQTFEEVAQTVIEQAAISSLGKTGTLNGTDSAKEATSTEPAKEFANKRKQKKAQRTLSKKTRTDRTAKALVEETPVEPTATDISIDPEHFLQFNEDNSRNIPAELLEQMEDFEGGNQDDLMVEAFQDDDVLAEFAEEKEEVEVGEKPKDIDLTLHGWGSWTGPGITENKKKHDRFKIKQKEKKRRDAGKRSVIIRESATAKTLAALQPRDVPFPFTSVKDFETVLKQPIGRDWNSQLAHAKVVRPSVVTKVCLRQRVIN
jgi:U3 small nucleolar RNA-associated protein 14